MHRFCYVFFLFLSLSVSAQTNVRTNPLQLLIGVLNTDVDFKIHRRWTLGPTLQFIDRKIEDYDVKAYGIGLRANYNLSGEVFHQGWYLGPSLSWLSIEVADKGTVLTPLTGEANGFALTAIFGYQWMWEHFNINLGVGPVVYTLSEIRLEDKSGTIKEEYDDSFAGAGMALEFNVGWKF
jgi:hypothetical protein